MSTQPDPLVGDLNPDRLYYAQGVLLSAEDLTDEQSYHRGRLALALAYLHGSGTIAGLRVTYDPADEFPSDDEQITVHPGVALDRIGRLVEVPRAACIRLNRWYTAQENDALNQAMFGAPFDGVIADLFLSFVVCERGKTPAFASGPFDALDAIAPSRLRDGYELSLVLRNRSEGEPPPLPISRYPQILTEGTPDEIAQSVNDFKNTLLDAYPRDNTGPNNPEPGGEYPFGVDQTAVFLARVVIGATVNPTAGEPPVRTGPATEPDPEGGDPIVVQPVTIDNHSRRFVFPTRAVVQQFITEG